jgi:hypothetical protein
LEELGGKIVRAIRATKVESIVTVARLLGNGERSFVTRRSPDSRDGNRSDS